MKLNKRSDGYDNLIEIMSYKYFLIKMDFKKEVIILWIFLKKIVFIIVNYERFLFGVKLKGLGVGGVVVIVLKLRRYEEVEGFD